MSFPVSGDEKQIITINDSSFKETIFSYIYIKTAILYFRLSTIYGRPDVFHCRLLTQIEDKDNLLNLIKTIRIPH